MATREMPKQSTNVIEQEYNSIYAEEPAIENEVVQTPKPTIGIVVNCKKLNLRTKPSKAANIIYEMPADSKLTINLDRSINGWFNVCTESGLEGFCMKEFVSIK